MQNCTISAYGFCIVVGNSHTIRRNTVCRLLLTYMYVFLNVQEAWQQHLKEITYILVVLTLATKDLSNIVCNFCSVFHTEGGHPGIFPLNKTKVPLPPPPSPPCTRIDNPVWNPVADAVHLLSFLVLCIFIVLWLSSIATVVLYVHTCTYLFHQLSVFAVKFLL